MTDIFSMISAIAAAIATIISLISLLLNIRHFSKSVSLGQLPFVNISYIEMDEGEVPNIISDLGEDKLGEKSVNFSLNINNMGSGFARDIWIEYKDKFHRSERYYAFNNVLLPKDSILYTFSLTNIIIGNDRFKGYDFELNIYYKDLLDNCFCINTHSVYLTYGDIEIKPQLTFSSQPHKIKKRRYPKKGRLMKVYQ